MRLPLFTYNPVKALVAIVDIRLEAFETVCHFPTDASLNVLIALRFGQTGSVSANTGNYL